MYQTKASPLFSFLLLYDLLHLKGMKRLILSLSLFLVATQVFLLAPTLGGLVADGRVYADDSAAVGVSACKFVPDDNGQRGKCETCFESKGAWTAVGCLGGETPNDFIASFIRIGTGLGGGVAFLLILFSGFQRIMSAGNPEKLHEAKDLMTSAISGLLLIIFSVFLLRLIGVDILQIPGLSN